MTIECDGIFAMYYFLSSLSNWTIRTRFIIRGHCSSFWFLIQLFCVYCTRLAVAKKIYVRYNRLLNIIFVKPSVNPVSEWRYELNTVALFCLLALTQHIYSMPVRLSTTRRRRRRRHPTTTTLTMVSGPSHNVVNYVEHAVDGNSGWIVVRCRKTNPTWTLLPVHIDDTMQSDHPPDFSYDTVILKTKSNHWCGSSIPRVICEHSSHPHLNHVWSSISASVRSSHTFSQTF